MASKYPGIIRKLISVIAGAIILFALGCAPFLPGASPTQTDPVENTTPTAVMATPKPLSTAADTISSNPLPTVITLTFWTVERFSPQIDLVSQQLADFEATHNNLNVEVFVKKTTGQASILNYLSSAKAVAPGILPDVIILPTEQLPQAWRAGLLQPLDGRIDRTIVQDLLPAAKRLGTVDEQLAGIPFELDVEHLVYNTSQITTTPALWSDVLSNNVRYQFPAKGQNGLLNDATAMQYLSAGGKFTDTAGAPAINEAAMQAVLKFYRATADNGIINQQILEAGQTDEQWAKYLSNPNGMVHVNAHHYLLDRRSLENSRAAAIPTQGGVPVTLGYGWAFAIVTSDPNRQSFAQALIEAFMETNANATWAIRTSVIPSRQSAFELVARDNDPYWLFLEDYLQTVTPPPSFAGYDQLSRILQQTIVQVINNEATPDEAIETAVNALKQ